MLVVDDGRRIGTVGGGEMEARVTEEADACLADGRSRLLDYRLVDPGAGDPGVCGGDVTIHLELHKIQPESTRFSQNPPDSSQIHPDSARIHQI